MEELLVKYNCDKKFDFYYFLSEFKLRSYNESASIILGSSFDPLMNSSTDNLLSLF
jgi:hypothetical protein